MAAKTRKADGSEVDHDEEEELNESGDGRAEPAVHSMRVDL